MFVPEISSWAAALMALLVSMALIALAYFDYLMLKRMLTVFGATVAQMVVVGAVVWAAYQTKAWWAYALWQPIIYVADSHHGSLKAPILLKPGDNRPYKIIRENHVFIIRDGKTYDVTGAELR